MMMFNIFAERRRISAISASVVRWRNAAGKRERVVRYIEILVVAEIRVNGGSSNCTVRAAGPLPITISSTPASIAG